MVLTSFISLLYTFHTLPSHVSSCRSSCAATSRAWCFFGVHLVVIPFLKGCWPEPFASSISFILFHTKSSMCRSSSFSHSSSTRFKPIATSQMTNTKRFTKLVAFVLQLCWLRASTWNRAKGTSFKMFQAWIWTSSPETQLILACCQAKTC